MQYKGINVVLRRHHYQNGRPALELVEELTNEPIARCTVNIPDYDLADEQHVVIIKDYSENEGMLDWLIANNIVTPSGLFAESGYIRAPIAYLVNQTESAQDAAATEEVHGS